MKAEAMLADFLQAGGKVEWRNLTNERACATFSHPMGGSVELDWGIEDARKAGLAGKDNWKNYPRAMLRALCISEGIRAVYPGVVVGVYTPEEVQDFSPAPATRDMGMVEEVQIPAVPQEPDGAYALYVPGNDQPYNRFHTVDEWLQGYVDMIARIHNSTKMPDGLKAEKIDSLKVCNMDMLDSLDSFQKIKIKSFMVQAGVPVTPKQDTPPLSPEVVHSETIS